MRTDVATAAANIGLHVSSWSPGDGVTRYRFSREEQDYDASDGLVTVAGRKDALLWLRGYRAGMMGE